MNNETLIFLAISYVVGTGFGYWQGRAHGLAQGIENTVDSLVNQGFLRHKKQAGEIEILKWNDSADQEG
mgnify:CR=1 FL=1|jgi:hypothetical protein|tara:strand:+ start:201 stop:407 length:207 start_codon:yes stop_codon:yes gene_type:complete